MPQATLSLSLNLDRSIIQNCEHQEEREEEHENLVNNVYYDCYYAFMDRYVKAYPLTALHFGIISSLS